MSEKTKKLTFTPIFSTKGVDPFDEMSWEKRNVGITDDAGKVIFQQNDVEVPKTWSELATKIAVSKYFHGDPDKGLDPHKGGRETSIKQLIHRVVHTIRMFGERDGYFARPQDADAFEQDLKWLCLNQYGAFNSPVWFNVGLFHEYGFGNASGEGNYIWKEIIPQKHAGTGSDTLGWAVRPLTQYEYPQGSACFIQKVEDNMESIMNLAYSEAMLFKFGSGTGTDLSTLRSFKERLSGGGRPSGPLSFLRVYDAVARVVKSGGKTRRAAKMNTLNTWHPDIEEFIEAKPTEEKKAWALIDQGYDGSYNGPAYDTIAFQNENLSVRADDDFMTKAQYAEDDKRGLYYTRAVVTGKSMEEKHARTMLRKIAEGTYLCGDPGMQFDTTIQSWHTCAGTEPIHSSNPCSEFIFLDNTACNLASLNLFKFKCKATGQFEIERYEAAIKVFITAQEILVDAASYPTPAIAINSHRFRPLGLGFANLGGLVMSYGLPYDSPEANSLAACLTSIMTGAAYTQSARMAEAMGSFEGYWNSMAFGIKKARTVTNVDSMMNVMEKHRKASLDIDTAVLVKFLGGEGAELMRRESTNVWDRAIALGGKHGYRNAQVTVLAPTGTIGFLMDCDTTGIEPETALVKYKLLAGGGMLKIVNQMVPAALHTLGYDQDQQTRITEHIIKLDTIEDVRAEVPGPGVEADRPMIRSGLKSEHLPVFDCAFKAAKGERSLGYRAHLNMMAACQPFLSGAISKTVNLPEKATVEDIMNTYIEGWKLGLKAIAIYRDSSKRSAPLNVKKTKDMGTSAIEKSGDYELLLQEFSEIKAYAVLLEEQHDKPVRKKMPDDRASFTHKFEISGHKGYLTAGMYPDGTPGEIFITMNKEGSTIGGLMDTVATLTSIALQYGVPLESLIKKFAFQRFEPSGFTKNPDIRMATSITDYVFRYLGCKFTPGYRESLSAKPHVEIGGLAHSRGESPVIEAPKEKSIMEGSGFLPDPCTNCGSLQVVRTGVCGTCTVCGTSQGCS